MIDNEELKYIETRFIEKGRFKTFSFFWKNRTFLNGFICRATPKGVSEAFGCTKTEAYKLIEIKFRAFQNQIRREITAKKRLISLLDNRLKIYKNQAFKGKTVTRICKKCGSVFQTVYEDKSKVCDKCKVF